MHTRPEHQCEEDRAYPEDDELVARQVRGEDRRVEAMILSRDVLEEAFLSGKLDVPQRR